MSIDLLKATRKNSVKVIDAFSEQQLFKIPDNFNNHLFWNFAHCVVTQQILCYKLSGLTPKIEGSLIDLYRKGSSPSSVNDLSHIRLFKELASTTIDQLNEDYQNGLFQSFKPYETSYGVTLKSIDNAIAFNNIHEAMHLGQMKSIAMLIK